MSTLDSTHPVVVGIGHDPVDAALAFGLDVAAREQRPLRLVHAVHLPWQGPETLLITEVDLERVGRGLVDQAAERVRALDPNVEVETQVRIGRVVPVLAQEAATARLVVLEHRELSMLRRVVTHSISSGVAARSTTPVASVPTGWVTRRESDVPPVVMVGVEEAGSEHVIAVAHDEARARDARLQVLHAWSLPPAYDGIVFETAHELEWRDRVATEVRAELDRQGIVADVDVQHAHPALALVRASRSVDLLVLGRHDPTVPFGSHLGPVASAVLREAHCPVLLVDPAPDRHPHRWSRHRDGEPLSAGPAAG